MSTSDQENLNPLFSNFPEKEYYQYSSLEKARKLGQYFTPYPIARFMAEWVNLASSLSRVMDPAVGLGIFFRALMDVNPGFSGTFHGFDIDPQALDHAKQIFSGLPSLKLVFYHQDFLLADGQPQFNGILSNPPYIRYKAIPDREKLIEKFGQDFGIAISKYSNLYGYFIIRCMQALAPHGRAAILVPSDFLYSGFGESIKQYLLSSGMLRHILFFNDKNSLFDDSITTSCILLLENDTVVKTASFITLDTIADLEPLAKDIQLLDQSTIPLTCIIPDTLLAHQKWSRYFFDSPPHKELQHLAAFTKLGRVKRGIATGDNRFFTFNREKITRTGIPVAYLLPCLSRSSQARFPFFTSTDFDDLEESGKSVYLLDADQNPEHPAVKAYLQQGEQAGSHQRYLTRFRSPWYRLENRPPAPILATTFNRQNLRFVRNEAAVRNLTCFHAIYMLPGLEEKADTLMAYLLTPLAHSLIQRNRRIYGDGLIKYEPNDLNSALIADLTLLPETLEKQTLSLYADYRHSCLQKQPDESIIEKLNVLFSDWMTPA